MKKSDDMTGRIVWMVVILCIAALAFALCGCATARAPGSQAEVSANINIFDLNWRAVISNAKGTNSVSPNQSGDASVPVSAIPKY